MDSPLGQYEDRELTLSALAEAARDLLSRAPRPTDDRVTPHPDERTLRWYQSMGVVDRPLRYEGRQAVYGYRHLLQAVAVKLLQGQGYSLAQVQRALQGHDTRRLEDAVREALDLGAPEGPDPVPEPESRFPPLIAVEVAPGITVTIDPRRVEDPSRVLRRIASALTLPSGDHR